MSNTNNIEGCNASIINRAGLYLYYSDFNNITNCISYLTITTFGGVHLESSSYNNITNCTFINNLVCGIYANTSPYNSFSNNQIKLIGRYGIYIQGTQKHHYN
jgi:parallel beta-helix repeat protein